MSYEPGTRVGAMLSSNKEQVNLLGYGVYEGDHIRPDVPPFEEAVKDPEIKEMLERASTDIERQKLMYESNPFYKNPRIKLDNGTIVWGFQCWWGPEDKIKDMITGRKVVMVDVMGNTI